MRNRGMIARICSCAAVSGVLVSALFSGTGSRVLAAGEGGNGKILVAMGDSYSSGEGIEPFFMQEQQDKYNYPSWMAHRSQNAWSGLLAVSDNESINASENDLWYFVASSGAVTDDLYGEQKKEYKTPLETVTMMLPPQLDVFRDEELNGKVDYVTITIGGNDVDFANIITTCAETEVFLSPNELSDKLNGSISYLYEGGLREKLAKLYRDVSEAAGPKAQVIVAGYPQLMDPGGDKTLISVAEASMVNDAVQIFNKEIRRIVNECRMEGVPVSFASVENEFLGHGAFSKEPYINGIILMPQSQDLSYVPPSAYSMHPNLDGAMAYSRCVQRKLDELEGRSTGEYNTGMTVVVYENGHPLNDYYVSVEGEEYFGLFKTGLIRKPYDMLFIADPEDGRLYIELPVGEYDVTILDNDGNELMTKPVKTVSDCTNTVCQFQLLTAEQGDMSAAAWPGVDVTAQPGAAEEPDESEADDGEEEAPVIVITADDNKEDEPVIVITADDTGNDDGSAVGAIGADRDTLLSILSAYSNDSMSADPVIADFNHDGYPEAVAEFGHEALDPNGFDSWEQYFVYTDGVNTYRFGDYISQLRYENNLFVIDTENEAHLAYGTRWRSQILGGLLCHSAVYRFTDSAAEPLYDQELTLIHDVDDNADTISVTVYDIMMNETEEVLHDTGHSVE